MSLQLPRDPALPQLATALDGAAMARVFADALHGPQVLACEVDRVKYRPLRNCSVSYRLTLHDAQRGLFEQRIAARFCGVSDAAQRYGKARSGTLQSSAAGPALQHVPALGMLAHWLPNDAKLDALRLLCDDAALRQCCLDELVAALTAGRGRLVDHHTTLVQVVPELRACARVELQLQSEPGTEASTHTLYVKTHVDRRGAATHRAMQALSASIAQAQGTLCTPRSVLWQGHAGLHWQLALPGRVLLDVDPGVGPDSSARVGRQLAALHGTPIGAAAPAIDRSTLRQQAEQACAMLAQVEPGWQALLTRLLGRLDAGAAWLDTSTPATLHGDLHPNNILVAQRAGGTCHAFIDLDDLHRGPAAVELGAWVADAFYRALLDGRDPATQAASCHAFLAAYAQASGHAVDSAALAWSTAHHLLCRRAHGGVANLKPGRFAGVPALLALADRVSQAGNVAAAFGSVGEAA